MRVSIFGTGYVGLVTGVCFAEMGNDVMCVDIDHDKVKRLQDGECPIYEPGLKEVLARNVAQGRLVFVADGSRAVEASEIIFIAVGTPQDDEGRADLRAVFAAAKTIACAMQSFKAIAIKSTVPVGTAQKVKAIVQDALDARGVDLTYEVISNPEFLKEGNALADCLKPDRVVVGCTSKRAESLMASLYAPFLRSGKPMLMMDPASSELTKYAANALLATKISFMNELSRLCDRLGADIEHVRRGIGQDPRIGQHFIYPGLGYGGSCFPKDVRALMHTAGDAGEHLGILAAVEAANQQQKERFFLGIAKHFRNGLRGRKLALWGLSFKPGTDDVREAPALFLIEQLLLAGATICAFDPVAMPRVQEALGPTDGMDYADNAYQALEGADGLCVVTEWPLFREPDFARMDTLMREFTIFDGRNVYDPRQILAMDGAQYYALGRGLTPPVAEVPQAPRKGPQAGVTVAMPGGRQVPRVS